MKYYSTDTNHSEIVKGLEGCGVSVMDNADSGRGRLDIITHFDLTCCIEIKFGARAEFKRKQLEFLANWKGLCGYVRNFDEALKLAKRPEDYALTAKQKLKILQWLARNPSRKTVLVSTFEKEAFGIIKI